NSLVPSVSPSACPASTTRTSSPLIFFSVSTSASCALAVSWLRVPKFWLGLLSITTAATEDNGSRSSRVKEGLASASRISAIAAARRARSCVVVILARQRLDPGLARVEAAGEVAQQVKRLGQHVLTRHRLQFRHVEGGENFTQGAHARRLRRAVLAGRRLDGV